MLHHALLPLLFLTFTAGFADSADWQRADRAEVRTAFARDCDDMLLQGIKSARKEILVAAFTFTRHQFADALIERKQNGVSVHVKMDATQAKSEYGKPIVKKLEDAGIAVKQIKMPSRQAQHNKFMVIDQNFVMTGSFNFSSAATNHNYENLVRIDSRITAGRFSREWQRIKGSR
jgi:phospholipase D